MQDDWSLDYMDADPDTVRLLGGKRVYDALQKNIEIFRNQDKYTTVKVVAASASLHWHGLISAEEWQEVMRKYKVGVG